MVRILIFLCFSIVLQAQTIQDFESSFNVKVDSTFLSNWKLESAEPSKLVFKQGKLGAWLMGKAKKAAYFMPNVESSIFINNFMKNAETGTTIFSIDSYTCDSLAAADWCAEFFTQPKERLSKLEHSRVQAFFDETNEILIFFVLFFDDPEQELLGEATSVFRFLQD